MTWTSFTIWLANLALVLAIAIPWRIIDNRKRAHEALDPGDSCDR